MMKDADLADKNRVKPAQDFGARLIDFRARSTIARERIRHASLPHPLPLPLIQTRREPSVPPHFVKGGLRPAKPLQKPAGETRHSEVPQGHLTVPPERTRDDEARTLPPSRLEARRGLTEQPLDNPLKPTSDVPLI
jgi:hypothetical protein